MTHEDALKAKEKDAVVAGSEMTSDSQVGISDCQLFNSATFQPRSDPCGSATVSKSCFGQ